MLRDTNLYSFCVSQIREEKRTFLLKDHFKLARLIFKGQNSSLLINFSTHLIESHWAYVGSHYFSFVLINST